MGKRLIANRNHRTLRQFVNRTERYQEIVCGLMPGSKSTWIVLPSGSRM
jgi:hypothetical protein